jgi:DNA-binding IclR family transcriptional regulator
MDVSARKSGRGVGRRDSRTRGNRSQRSIQSIEVGFRLIRVLERAASNLPLKTIATLAGMPPSKAHLYLVSFTRLGLVVQDPATMRYGLGPYAVHLGLAGLRQLDVVEAARGPMHELQSRTGVACYLSVWGNRGPAIVMKLDSALEAPFEIRVGYVLPLMATATGRVYLACLPKAVTAPVLAREKPADRALRTRAQRAIAAVHRHGIAFSDGMHHAGFAALSAPVFDHSGSLAAAITLLGQRGHLALDLSGAAAHALRNAARTVGAALGHVNGKHAGAPPARPRAKRGAQRN